MGHAHRKTNEKRLLANVIRHRTAQLDRDRTRLALNRRLEEKAQNYERVATLLSNAGETDAANALARAANQLRTITQ